MASSKQTTTAGSAASPTDMFMQNTQMFGFGAKVQANGVARLIQMQQAYLAFLGKRLERDRALMGDLAALSSPADAPDIWADYFQTAQADYAEELQTQLGRLAEGARAATEDLQQQVGETAAAKGPTAAFGGSGRKGT